LEERGELEINLASLKKEHDRVKANVKQKQTAIDKIKVNLYSKPCRERERCCMLKIN
jgi:hypothetical protein